MDSNNFLALVVVGVAVAVAVGSIVWAQISKNNSKIDSLKEDLKRFEGDTEKNIARCVDEIICATEGHVDRCIDEIVDEIHSDQDYTINLGNGGPVDDRREDSTPTEQ